MPESPVTFLMPTLAPDEAARPHIARRYLTFVVGDAAYGLPIPKVREIVRQVSITPFPRLPEYIRGVINLRGKIVPVIDLRKKFGLVDAAEAGRGCIVVTYVLLAGTTKLLGLLVDAIDETQRAEDSDLPPGTGLKRATGFFRRLTRAGRQMKALDVDLIAREDSHRLPFAASSVESPPAWA